MGGVYFHYIRAIWVTLVVALDAFKDLKCFSKIRQVLNHGLKTHG